LRPYLATGGNDRHGLCGHRHSPGLSRVTPAAQGFQSRRGRQMIVVWQDVKSSPVYRAMLDNDPLPSPMRRCASRLGATILSRLGAFTSPRR
jgi:hypothetical protein